MTVIALGAQTRGAASSRPTDPALEEHPRVVLGDVGARPRGTGHILVFANEKGGVGKSTLAFQCTVALCNAGYRVAAIDLDRRQRTFDRSLENRDATARILGVELPAPRHLALHQHSGAMLCQEITRIGWGCDFVVIDVAGHDSPIGRRAIALADTLVTPINSSFIDLDLLGRLDAHNGAMRETGCFARLVNGLREARAEMEMRPIDWVVVPNRLRRGASRDHQRFEHAVAALADQCGFRIAPGMAERVAYRELFLMGLTHFDLAKLPGVGRGNGQAQRDVQTLVEALDLPQAPLLTRMRAG